MTMKDIKKLYFSLCGLNDEEGYIVLVITNSENDHIFYAKSNSEILRRLQKENIKDIKEIYISNTISEELLNEINKIAKFEIYISPINEKVYGNIILEESFINYQSFISPFKDVIDLANSNIYFKEYFNDLSKTLKNNDDAIKEILSLDIINKSLDCVNFTINGDLIFSDNYEFIREVNIKDTSVNNSLYFSSEKSFNGPLIFLIPSTIKTFKGIIPDIQVRENAQSVIKKLIDDTITEYLIILCICLHDYTKNKPVEFELTQTSITAKYLESNAKTIKNFFEKYFRKTISYEELSSKCFEENLSIEKARKEKQVTIKIYFSHKTIIVDNDLDNLDYEIIRFAKNNVDFTRKMIDQRFNISPRNSNARIRKMLNKNILKSKGESRAIRYNYNND